MNLTIFLKLVEIQTKIASFTPFLMGNLYLFYHYANFKITNFILMFFSLLCVDMGTTVVNNYQDYLRAEKKEGYNYEKHNAIVNYNLSKKTVKKTILILFLLAIVFGLLLYLNTDVIVLIIGFISFVIGILYTSGPVPISRTPLGEIFSGLTMGFFITFLAIYIHNLNLINIFIKFNSMVIDLQYLSILKIFIFSMPLIFGIANIMLANNICDIEDDRENNRYTLPIYISRSSSLKLFRYLYYLSYLSIIISVILNILPSISLFALLSFVKVNQNINKFEKKQSKKDTFVLAVNNFMVINYSTAFTIILAIIL
ncbi:Putative prenyltransferase, contains 1,4-dihydroxy-2-naphthoate octaprenyltransferase domain [Halanaerobium saccharolyticum subsp. saccharolyticum DSM 6643]|uniref:Putative prenyltransferase, contains 1,4-dihydroxy-2-naphthoate octaprenyltransferase domain n=1 Tax=Halanaerobium saccharolyticum subsp. saccharolyticum DSM 6643 TaxID=1293054 RepID=M5E155_9FIRM|nr:1,4-dihydroxy-2-naphthoate polyprenyltransferase [Halanaerobium saccharolyticum]CCU79508.1 Putative prenyltransferase, contains 1,4-dihydroxy-2-naphthoate octaprenyltransferase domain [Halanaerobium saccharolyticum subsp. saccharolyticum DSM 6643]